MDLEFGYWATRCIGQPIRLMLEYAGAKWEDKIYQAGPPPDFDKSCWFDVKEKLGLAFPNLPYLIERDAQGNTVRSMSQSVTIMSFIARRYNLLPETEEGYLRMDQMRDETVDFRDRFMDVCYSSNFEELKGDFLDALPGKLKKLEQYMAGHEWVAGKKLTYVDFMFAEILDHHLCLVPDCLKELPHLSNYHMRFFNLPRIKSYRSSERCIGRPLNNKYASFY